MARKRTRRDHLTRLIPKRWRSFPPVAGNLPLVFGRWRPRRRPVQFDEVLPNVIFRKTSTNTQESCNLSTTSEKMIEGTQDVDGNIQIDSTVLCPVLARGGPTFRMGPWYAKGYVQSIMQEQDIVKVKLEAPKADKTTVRWEWTGKKDKCALVNTGENIDACKGDVSNLRVTTPIAVVDAIFRRWINGWNCMQVDSILVYVCPPPAELVENQFSENETTVESWTGAILRRRFICERNPIFICDGQSGAGKTSALGEVVQKFMVCEVSPSRELRENRKELFDAATVLLEAFGSASTVNNDSATRFSMLRQIWIPGEKNDAFLNSRVSCIYLESTRTMFRNKSERNFHIFYQVLRGLSKELKEMYELKHVSHYAALAGVNSIRGMNDGQRFKQETMPAFEKLGITDEEQCFIYRGLGATLDCGNLGFAEKDNQTAYCITPVLLEGIAAWLKYTPETLADFLELGSASAKVASKKAANLGCLAYRKIFDWLVERLNQATLARPVETTRWMGVFDQPGGEIAATNTLDQFNANHTAERIHSLFVEHMAQENKCCSHSNDELDENILQHIDISAPPLQNIEKVANVGEEGKLKTSVLFDLFHKAWKRSETDLEKACHSMLDRVAGLQNSDRPTAKFKVQHYFGQVEYNITYFNDSSVQSGLPGLGGMAFGQPVGGRLEGMTDQELLVGKASRWHIHFAALEDFFCDSNNSLHFIRCFRSFQPGSTTRFDATYVMDALRNSGVEALLPNSQDASRTIKHQDFLAEFCPAMFATRILRRPATYDTEIFIKDFLQKNREIKHGTFKVENEVVTLQRKPLDIIEQLNTECGTVVRRMVIGLQTAMRRKREISRMWEIWQHRAKFLPQLQNLLRVRLAIFQSRDRVESAGSKMSQENSRARRRRLWSGGDSLKGAQNSFANTLKTFKLRRRLASLCAKEGRVSTQGAVRTARLRERMSGNILSESKAEMQNIMRTAIVRLRHMKGLYAIAEQNAWKEVLLPAMQTLYQRLVFQGAIRCRRAATVQRAWRKALKRKNTANEALDKSKEMIAANCHRFAAWLLVGRLWHADGAFTDAWALKAALKAAALRLRLSDKLLDDKKNAALAIQSALRGEIVRREVFDKRLKIAMNDIAATCRCYEARRALVELRHVNRRMKASNVWLGCISTLAARCKFLAHARWWRAGKVISLGVRRWVVKWRRRKIQRGRDAVNLLNLIHAFTQMANSQEEIARLRIKRRNAIALSKFASAARTFHVRLRFAREVQTRKIEKANTILTAFIRGWKVRNDPALAEVQKVRQNVKQHFSFLASAQNRNPGNAASSIQRLWRRRSDAIHQSAASKFVRLSRERAAARRATESSIRQLQILSSRNDFVTLVHAHVFRREICPDKQETTLGQQPSFLKAFIRIGEGMSDFDFGEDFAVGIGAKTGSAYVAKSNAVSRLVLRGPIVGNHAAISLNNKVTRVVCGRGHALLTTREGVLFAWGNNSVGQCGVQPLSGNEAMITMPTCVQSSASAKEGTVPERLGFLGVLLKGGMPNVRHVSCGERCSGAVDVNGAMWLWGKVQDLGLQRVVPTKLASLPNGDAVQPFMLFGHGREAYWPESPPGNRGGLNLEVTMDTAKCMWSRLTAGIAVKELRNNVGVPTVCASVAVCSLPESRALRGGSGIEVEVSAQGQVAVVTVARLHGSPFTQVELGPGGTNVAINEKNFVCTWGTVTEHQLIGRRAKQGSSMDKLGSVMPPSRLPMFVTHSLAIKSVSVGATHAVALSNHGRVFTWGTLEVCPQNEKVFAKKVLPEPVHVEGALKDVRITHAVAGSGETAIAVQDETKLFGWSSLEISPCGDRLWPFMFEYLVDLPGRCRRLSMPSSEVFQVLIAEHDGPDGSPGVVQTGQVRTPSSKVWQPASKAASRRCFGSLATAALQLAGEGRA